MSEREIFMVALDLPAAARTEYLDKACGTDAVVRSRVEALLRSHEAAGSFLGTPAVASRDPGTATTRTIGHEGGAAADDEVLFGFLAPATRPDALGRIGHYEVLQVLGRGGFGIVFRAFDEVLQRVVAVKVLAPQLAATSPARKRFLREARTSAAVRHENVVQVYEVGEDPLPYIAMEFIPGETLQQRLDRTGPIEPAEVVRVGRQIAEGLAAAHANDLIHRDIKPGNILLEGGQQKVKITDFGLARAADDASISRSGIIAGTPMYMAPEQAKGEKLDQRADLFSLGSVLYQMAAGRPPFRANGTVAVLKRVAEDTPRDIREITPETPQWLCGIIAKLHAKNPDERFQSAREVADVLADCEAQLKAHAKLKDFSRIPRGKAQPSGRRKWVAAAAVLLPVIALAVTEFAGVTHLFRGQQAARDNGPASVAKDELPPLDDGWVRLLNGRDKTGWKTRPEAPGQWEVRDGVLIGSGQPSVLYSERGDYANFYLRAEAKVNLGGDSGIFFRCSFGTPMENKARDFGAAGGFEVEILKTTYARKTGSVTALKEGPPVILGLTSDDSLTKPDEWFTLEIHVEQDRFITKVNGKETANCRDPFNKPLSGHIGLQVWSPNTIVQFRKIEIKELPASATSLPPTYTNSIGMEFVLVPKGKSWLGGGKDKLGDKEVEIAADFYLGKYEITQEEWEKVMGANPSWFSRVGAGKNVVKDIPDADLKRFPVENVSWDQCQLFVSRLNQLEKEAGWLYRLPLEAEWEYACRGGPMSDKRDSTFDFYFAKPTNTLLPARAIFNNSLQRPGKVGSYEPNVLGLHDMHGNVEEWCDDPHWVGSGGGFQSGASDCRAASRSGTIDGIGNRGLGLRLVRVRLGTPAPKVKAPPIVDPFTDADVQRIAALPAEQQVEEVRKDLMRRNPGFDGKFEHKIEDGGVTEFKIVTDQVTDITPIRVFNALRVLDCRGTNDDGQPNGLLADLTPLGRMNFAGLEHLNLDNTKVGAAGLEIFKNCKGLTGLGLSGTRITDAGLAHFKDCKELTVLHMAGTQVSDAGLAHVKERKSLTKLFLDSTQITDAGLDDFAGLDQLTELNLANTKVTAKGVEGLAKALPKCKLTWDGGSIEPK